MTHHETGVTPPSFVDVRRFAEATELGVQPPMSPLAEAFLASRRVLDLPDGPVEIGAIDLPSGQGAVGELPADELVIVSSGKVTLTQPARTLVITEGGKRSLAARPRLRVVLRNPGDSTLYAIQGGHPPPTPRSYCLAPYRRSSAHVSSATNTRGAMTRPRLLESSSNSLSPVTSSRSALAASRSHRN